MGGFLGIGGNSANTDRGNQLAATSGLWNIFNTALPLGQQGQSAGSSNLASAGNFFSKLLTAGRTDTAARSAPAVNAELAGSDAAKRREASTGTGRTGGTAELNREAAGTTQSNIDNIINKNLMQGQAEGAKGLQSVGTTQLSNAENLLGLGATADTSILNNATESRKTSQAIHDEAAQGYGAAFGTVLQALMAGG